MRFEAQAAFAGTLQENHTPNQLYTWQPTAITLANTLRPVRQIDVAT
jgi:hypothetical protein